MNTTQFRAQARSFYDQAEGRIAGVGAEQYYDPETDTQKFESLSPDQLLEEAKAELLDLANYAMMTSLRLERIYGIINAVPK